MRKYLSEIYDEDTKVFTDIEIHKVKCEHCGNGMIFIKRDRLLCDNCYRWVYKNDKAKFKYKILEAKERNKRNEKHNN